MHSILSASRQQSRRLEAFRNISGLSLPSTELLQAFPELKNARSMVKNAKFEQAFDVISRCHDIVSRATGPSSALTFQLALQKADVVRYFGNYKQASDIMQSYEVSASSDEAITNIITKLQVISLCTLQSGQAKKAVEIAAEAIDLCERKNADTKLFSPCYAIKGLALMLEGDYKEADTFLQLSARWSESQIDQCKSLSNLGALQFIQCSDAKYNYAQTLQLEFVDSWNFKLQTSEFESSASEYFEDAIKLSTDPLNSNSGGNFCGTTSTESNVLGPDNSVAYSSFSSSRPEISSAESPDNQKRLIEQPSLAICHAEVLCNAAEVRWRLGDRQYASELLSSALKTLDALEKKETIVGSSVQEEEEDQLSISLDSAPILGRVLGSIAVLHAESAQAVTAEGLYRASLEKFDQKGLRHDYRTLYEKAIVLGRYGALLKKWEKRESRGDALLEEAKSIIAGLPRFPSGVLLSHTIQYPI